MEALTIIILSIVFLIAIVVVCYFFLQQTKQFVTNEQKKTILEIQKIQEAQLRKVVTPIQLQSYERLVLMLERMKPENLVLRCYSADMSTKLLKDVMIQNIRDEYEHNLSSQLYISNKAWIYIQNAKEDMINHLNAISPKQDEKLSPTQYAGLLFEQMANQKSPIEIAQENLKQEIQSKYQ